MKRKICIVFIFGLAMIGSLCGCGKEENEVKSSYEELDVEYTLNEDSTYTCRGNTYKYKMDISGMDGDSQVTFVVLTNDVDIKFEDVSGSLKKAEISIEESPKFVILGWY